MTKSILKLLSVRRNGCRQVYKGAVDDGMVLTNISWETTEHKIVTYQAVIIKSLVAIFQSVNLILFIWHHSDLPLSSLVAKA